MTAATYQAVGVIEGTFVPERGVVIGKDGTTYPASCVPGVRRFYERHPKKAAQARYLICWPRTSDTGKQVHLTVTDAPADPDRQASLKREAGRFKISGVITNQRSRLNRVVVRVVRNKAVPRKQRHISQYKTHLLFLTGRAAPFGNFVNKHTTFTCELKAHELRIRGIEDTQVLETVTYEAGGLQFPWPFMATRRHVDLFCSLNGAGEASVLALDDFRGRLQLRLQGLDQLVEARASSTNPEEQLITDRISKVRQRIGNFVRRMGDMELQTLLEDTGLLVALSRLQLEPSTNPLPEQQAMPATATPSVTLPKHLEKVAEQVCNGAPDALIAMNPGMTLKKVKASVAALMNTEGWWDSLPADAQARAQKGSYQVRKALKQRGSAV